MPIISQIACIGSSAAMSNVNSISSRPSIDSTIVRARVAIESASIEIMRGVNPADTSRR
jgi:hypothetical protein